MSDFDFMEYMISGKWQFEKPRLQRMFMDFLTKEGYEPELDEQGDVWFKYKEGLYSFRVYDDDPGFAGLRFRVKAELGENLAYAHVAASKTNGSVKLAKVYVRDGNDDEAFADEQLVVFALDFFLTNPGQFKKQFQRMIGELEEAYDVFNEIMEQLCSHEEDDQE